MPTPTFFDWSAPLLPAMVDRLLPQRGEGPLDMGDALILAPTRQAGRRLRETLAREWRRRGGTALLSLEVHPPSYLLQPADHVPAAHRFDWTRAWRDVLAAVDPRTLPHLFPERVDPPGPEEALAFGQRLQDLREDLLDAGLDFHAVAARTDDGMEQARWHNLASLEALYRTRLEEQGLIDPIDAKRRRIDSYTPAPPISRIILAGVPDPSPVVLRRLQALEDQGYDIHVWIHAPPSESASFDAWGAPSPAWRTRPLGRGDEPEGWIESLADPAAASRRVAEHLRQAPDSPALALGLLHDPSALPIRHELESAGKRLYLPNPVSLAESPALRLLDALEDQRTHDDPVSLRALWRHPALLRACGVKDPDAWLAAWDDYASRTFPDSAAAVDATLDSEVLRPAWERARAFLDAGGATHALDLLRNAYRGVRLHPDRPADRYRRRQLDAVAELLTEAARREEAGHPVPGAILLGALRRETVDPPRVEEAFTAEGWLELPYHPAPSLLLVGFQEGLVPPAPAPDGFLPHSLRAALGLKSDRDWLARDAYLFHSLLMSRAPDRVRVLVMKRDAEGNPLLPSRYLFACPKAEMLRRADLLFREPPPPPLQPPPAPGVPLRVPPTLESPLETLSATALKDYLVCPTRFYLKHVLRMRALDDTTPHPDAAAFGTLVHAVLRDVVAQNLSSRADWDRAVEDTVETRMRERFGNIEGLALRVMARGMAARIRAAGRIHLDLRDNGWRTIALEKKLKRDLHGLSIHGVIDRIDVHPDHGLLLLDYKTADTPKKPAETHLGPVRPGREAFEVEVKNKTRRWTDLQLPVYRWLAEADPDLPSDAPLAVAYLNLPKSIRQTQQALWPEEASLIGPARLCLERVVDGIRGGVWGPPATDVDYDDFAPLLHHGADWIGG